MNQNIHKLRYSIFSPFLNGKLLLLPAFGLCLLSCQGGSGTKDLASTTDSLSSYQSDRRDSLSQDSAGNSSASQKGDALTMKSKIDDDQANFMKEAALGSMMEIEAGKLAAVKAADAPVKEFALKMVSDHTKASADLKPIAAELGVILPSVLSGDHADDLKMLGAKSGAGFDQSYMSMMVKDHAKTVELFKRYTSARNPKVADFASKYLPVIEEHYTDAQNIK